MGNKTFSYTSISLCIPLKMLWERKCGQKLCIDSIWESTPRISGLWLVLWLSKLSCAPCWSAGLNPGFSASIQHLMDSGRQQRAVQVFGSLLSPWTNQMVSQAPASALGQLWLSRALGSKHERSLTHSFK